MVRIGCDRVAKVAKRVERVMGKWTGRHRAALGLAMAVGLVAPASAAPLPSGSAARQGLVVVLVQAQPQAPSAQKQAPGTPPPKKSTTAKASPGAGPVDAKPATGSASDAGLRQRVEQLEEQLVDMQVTMGTLESLARAPQAPSSAPPVRGGQPPPSAPFNAADAQRTEQLELQLRALVQQVEQLSDRLRQMEGSRPAQAARPPANPAPTSPTSPSGSFGTTVVTPTPPRRGDSIADVIGSETKTGAPQAPSTVGSGQSPKALYEQAYAFLLARDYAAAETAFTEFLDVHPNDELAGNAQFWLGETHYFRNQFKPAAAAYYKGYQTYGRSLKAADSLLKLALSLDRLGQRDAACKSFTELSQKFPNASPQIKTRALNEEQRMGCQ